MGLSEEVLPPTREKSIRAVFAEKGWSTSVGYPAFLLERIKTVFAGKAACYGKQRSDYRNQVGLGDEATLIAFETRWQQNVRAILPHGEMLEAIYVLPSQESLRQWNEFEAFVRALFPDRELTIELVLGNDGKPFKRPSAPGEKDRDYEDYSYVWAGLSQAIDRAHAKFVNENCPLADSEICIDVTAGQKIFSMAGANVTLNREVKLSYVNNDGLVTVYNAEIDTADSMRRILNAGGAGL